MTTVTMDKTGNMRIPDDARKALGLDEGGQVDVEVKHGPDGTAVVIRHHIPDEDAWAYTEENREAVRRARADIAAGRVFSMSEDELRKLADVADDDSLE
jgi:bifunctional DNA-binding transcriptional regulator/antitoxin component of YhaV-PrlF toxin-antitoxin module